MKKLRTALCLTVIALCLPGIVLSARRLPLRRSDLIAKKYAGWSGVLRIHAFEGWTGGDAAAGWVRRCAAAFERSHPGVYIEVKSTEPDRLLGEDGVRAPDMILFPPGLLSSVDGLSPLSELPVRADLLGAGQGFAAPVALGGYAWAVNASATGRAVPADEPWRRWSLAAAVEPDLTGETAPTSPGIDLGLTAVADASSPLDRFLRGELGAVCVTQREVARLNRLADQGLGPDWTLFPSASFTDQLIYLAALETNDEREQLSRAFILHLLTPDCQRMLVNAGLFTALDAPTGYTAGSAMEIMDGCLLKEGFSVLPAFNLNYEP